MNSTVDISDIRKTGPFSFRWPTGTEDFEQGWECTLRIDGAIHRVRHGIGARVVYGRGRVHTVTWLDGGVQVEGVEADDYPVTMALLSVLKRPDKKYVRSQEEVPKGYEGFDVVDHRREIDAPYSRNCLAVKIAEDDLGAWAHHAWLRSRLRSVASVVSVSPQARDAALLPAPPTLDQRAVVRVLLAHGEALADELAGGPLSFTPDPEANELVHTDPFAFLIGVVCDHGIRAERAWAVPYELRRRIGHVDPVRLAVEPDTVAAAFAQPPKLHRFINTVPGWVVRAAQMVTDEYDGDASRIWGDRPTAADLRGRLRRFPGIEQKKSAMAVELLERYLGVPLDVMSGSDIAYDVHIRRVFLRTELADRDDVHHMVAAARALHPERPGALDTPAWDVGRRWCRPSDPDCPTCPILGACPRLVDSAASVRGPGG
jgi:uncharacterized HhH-GPD family protein